MYKIRNIYLKESVKFQNEIKQIAFIANATEAIK